MTARGQEMQADVLAILDANTKPMSAYAVLNALKAKYPKIAPPTVYRAMGALIERGAVHRLESLNAFMSCKCAAQGDASILSICDDCGGVEESQSSKLVNDLSGLIGKSGFEPRRHVIEVHGVCASCGSEEKHP